MNVVLTQNYYNLMNAIHNTQDSGVPSEFSNSPDVDGGRNIITMKTGTMDDPAYTFHPTGTQKIIQLGKYGTLSSIATPTKVHAYDETLSEYSELYCETYRYAVQGLLSLPQTIVQPFGSVNKIPWNTISFAASNDTTPITRETTTATEDIVRLEEQPWHERQISKNGFSVTLRLYGNYVEYNINKIYILIAGYQPAHIGWILLGGINLPNPITLAKETDFVLSLGCTSNFS